MDGYRLEPSIFYLTCVKSWVAPKGEDLTVIDLVIIRQGIMAFDRIVEETLRFEYVRVDLSALDHQVGFDI